MKVAVVDYGVGNLKSVAGALKLAAGARSADVIVTSCASVLKACDRVVLPGVGSFGSCWRKLQACALADALCHVALVTKLPVLGVCVGMQLMASLSLEGAKTAGFNWLPGVVTRLPSRAGRVPHVG